MHGAETEKRQIRIRAAEDRDRQGLIALIKPIFSEYAGVEFALDEMPELNCIASTFSFANGEFWCAIDVSQIVGSVGWTPTLRGDGIELKKLYVAAAQRRRGLATRLVDRVERSATQRGIRFIELWSDVRFVNAHLFYERRGYRRSQHTRSLGDRSNSVEYHFCKKLRISER